MASNRRGTSKFTCYFCNKTIENDTELGHTAMCGNVLVPCPNKCGSYIPRMEMNRHKRECINRITKSMPRLTPLDENSPYRNQDMPSSTASLDRYSNGYPQKTSDQRINELSRRLADLEKRHFQNQHNSQTQNMAHKFESLKTSQMQQSLEIEKIKYHNKIGSDWKQNMESQLHNLNQSISFFQNAKKDADMNWISVKDRLSILDKVQMDLNYLKESLVQEQTYNRQSSKNIQQDLNAFRDLLTQENATTAAVFNGHEVTIDRLKHDIEDIKKMFEEQKAKFTNIVFDLRAASQIASEASERIEIHERDFAETKKEIDQIKLDLEILEGLSSSSENNFSCGRLIWKITEVESKMQRAKDFDTVLKSPIFFTHEYGYKIRILLYLNGLKKWKDRYALLCINVLKGEYDMLLKWPCHIEGTVTIRDLENLDKGKPFSKYIIARRQRGDEEGDEPQESSSTFIFIPHGTLFKQNFIKEDTMFIEVKIQQNTKLETSL